MVVKSILKRLVYASSVVLAAVLVFVTVQDNSTLGGLADEPGDILISTAHADAVGGGGGGVPCVSFTSGPKGSGFSVYCGPVGGDDNGGDVGGDAGI